MKTPTLITTAAAIGLASMCLTTPASAQTSNRDRRVLYFTKSAGFEHSVVKRDGDRLSHSEQILTAVLAREGISLVCTKDGGMISADRLETFNTVIFYSSGNILEPGTDGHPPVAQAGLAALFDWVRAGGGMIAIHAGTDTLRDENAPSEYTRLVGGTFAGHGAQELATLDVVDPQFPAMVGLPVQFRMIDEWYLHRQINAGNDMRVLMLLDTQSMKQEMYTKLPPQPITWCSNYGKGRVFVTALGHREDVWEMPLYQGMLVKAIAWTAGDVPGDATPNFAQYLK